MIEEEIKKEIRDIINKNKYYFTKKQLSKLLLELVDEIQVIDKDDINNEILDITDYAIRYVTNRVKLVLNRYYINKTTQ